MRKLSDFISNRLLCALLFPLIYFCVSSCTELEDSFSTKCPCIVNKVEKIDTLYKIQVTGVSFIYDNHVKKIYLWSNEPYSIGDTLKFVKSK